MSKTCETNNTKLPLKERMRTWGFWKTVLFTVTGGLGGFLYYHFAGCSSGTCAITGNPYASVAFGSLLGYLFVNRPCGC